VSLWAWSGAGIGAFLLLYAALVLALVIVGRRERPARSPASSPTASCCVAACSATRACHGGTSSFAGQLDDVVIVALVLRRLLRGGGEPLVREHWPGPESSLAFVLRLAA
jgi:hypothetical protein